MTLIFEDGGGPNGVLPFKQCDMTPFSKWCQQEGTYPLQLKTLWLPKKKSGEQNDEVSGTPPKRVARKRIVWCGKGAKSPSSGEEELESGQGRNSRSSALLHTWQWGDPEARKRPLRSRLQSPGITHDLDVHPSEEHPCVANSTSTPEVRDPRVFFRGGS